MSTSVSKPYLEQWVEQLKTDDEKLIAQGKKRPCPKIRQRRGEQKVAAWRQFCTWASPVHQWAQVYLPHWMTIPFTSFHSDMMQFFVDCWLGKMPEGKRRGVKVSPRTFAKSTCGKIAALYMMTEAVYTGQYVPRAGTDYDMIYVTGGDDLALQAMEPMWTQLRENQGILSTYGVLLRNRPKEGLNTLLANGYRIMGMGKNRRILGNHPIHLFLDDLENDENISNDETRAKFRRWYSEILDEMMPPGTYQVILGNYTHILCWLRYIAHDPESFLNFHSALETDGSGQERSIWEARFSTEFLQKKRELKPYEFATLFMNMPMVMSGSPVDFNEIRYYDESEMKESWWRTLTIVEMTDPGISQQERGCETAICLLAGDHKTKRSELYVLEIRSGHWSDRETLNQIHLLHEKYEPDHEGIEDATFQRMFTTLSELSEDRPLGCRLRRHNCLNHGRKKKHRLQKASVHIKNVRFKRGCSKQQRLIDQLVTYAEGDKFDLGDAFCMAVNEFDRLYPPGIDRHSKLWVPQFDLTGCITGYVQQ